MGEDELRLGVLETALLALQERSASGIRTREFSCLGDGRTDGGDDDNVVVVLLKEFGLVGGHGG